MLVSLEVIEQKVATKIGVRKRLLHRRAATEPALEGVAGAVGRGDQEAGPPARKTPTGVSELSVEEAEVGVVEALPVRRIREDQPAPGRAALLLDDRRDRLGGQS